MYIVVVYVLINYKVMDVNVPTTVCLCHGIESDKLPPKVVPIFTNRAYLSAQNSIPELASVYRFCLKIEWSLSRGRFDD